MHNEIIEISKDDQLVRRTLGVHGSKKYKMLSNYILEIFENRIIVLSDGTEAIIDRRDSMHISKEAWTYKTAEISKIREIIENSKLYAVDKEVIHNKFNMFKYYKATVGINKKQYDVYVNVGRAKNDYTYHIYDITKRIRESAHRVNDVERLL